MVVMALGHPSSQTRNRYGEYLQQHRGASSFWPTEGEKVGVPPSTAREAMSLARSVHFLGHNKALAITSCLFACWFLCLSSPFSLGQLGQTRFNAKGGRGLTGQRNTHASSRGSQRSGDPEISEKQNVHSSLLAITVGQLPLLRFLACAQDHSEACHPIPDPHLHSFSHTSCTNSHSNFSFYLSTLCPNHTPTQSESVSNYEMEGFVRKLLAESLSLSKPHSLQNYCKLPNAYFPSGFKAMKYRKYDGTSDPQFHLAGFLMDSHSWLYDRVLMVHLFQQSLEEEALRGSIYLSSRPLSIHFSYQEFIDLNRLLWYRGIPRNRCRLRYGTPECQSAICKLQEFKKHRSRYWRSKRTLHSSLLASADDNVTVNGASQPTYSGELEGTGVKFEESLEDDDTSSRLVQALHDAARAIEMAITEHSSSVKSSWFSKAWIGVDKNAWIKTFSYQLGSSTISITHLQYVDDTILFLTDEDQQLVDTKLMLEVLQEVTGLKVSYTKSLMAGVTMEEQNIR
ncbi:hypothetical protein Taro_010085 [Colocasia esculenta]|uniref:Uncharacterized protein n=1 Tax=Colocasia esculenta TaxID=4460 RepID=A0A843U6Q4_COLES|nr:hypothetical protein [Colocasia esculenta]